MDWDIQTLQAIRKQKEREKSHDRDNALKLASADLYADKVHFALELIQNAEDAKASAVTFICGYDRLVVVNNGEPFTPDNVEGICSVNTGQKKNKIGFFGIGFKSVAKVTDSPQVISGRFNFYIENKLYPHPGRELPSELAAYREPERGAIFILPYSPSLVPDPQGIVQRFRELDDKLLLFLEHVQNVTFIDQVNGDQWQWTKRSLGDARYELINPARDQPSEEWLVYHEKLAVPPGKAPPNRPDIEEARLTVAFPVNGPRDEAEVLYCYLPTNMRTDLSFLIQADFTTTTNRESILDEPWNQWLLEELGGHAARRLYEISRTDRYRTAVWHFIPLAAEMKQKKMMSFYEALRDHLVRLRISPVAGLGWVRPDETALPTDDRITSLLTEEDLRTLQGRKLRYVALDVPARGREILEELGSATVDGDAVLELAEREERLRGRSPSWFLQLYDFIAEHVQAELKLPPQRQVRLRRFQNASCMVTNGNRLVRLISPGQRARLVCYPSTVKPTGIEDLFRAEEWVVLHPFLQLSSVIKHKETDVIEEAARTRVRDFLSELDVRLSVKPAFIIRDLIIPKFRREEYHRWDAATSFRFLDYIRANFPSYESEMRRSRAALRTEADVFADLAMTLKVPCWSMHGKRPIPGWRSPGDAYFPAAFGKHEEMEALFSGVPDIWFVSERFAERVSQPARKRRMTAPPAKVEHNWRQFLSMLGVRSSVRFITHAEHIVRIDQYPWLPSVRTTFDYYKLVNHTESPNLAALLAHIQGLPSAQATERSELLWRLLERSWRQIGKRMRDTDMTWFYYNWNNRKSVKTSSALQLLRECAWVPASDGALHKPSDLFAYSTDNGMLLGTDALFVKQRGDPEFLRDVGVALTPGLARVKQRLLALRAADSGENLIQQVTAIYTFLEGQVRANLVSPSELSKWLHQNYLFYLPRQDRRWWQPAEVFWRDCQHLFGSHRGYVEHPSGNHYPDGLRGFLLELGVTDKPEYRHALALLQKLAPELEAYEHIAGRLFDFLEENCKRGIAFDYAWHTLSLRARSGALLPPNLLFVAEGDDATLFGQKIDVVWLPGPQARFHRFLSAAGCTHLPGRMQVTVIADELVEVDGGKTAALMRVVEGVGHLVRSYSPGFAMLDTDQPITLVRTARCRVKHRVKRLDGNGFVEATVAKQVFLDCQERRLYLAPDIDGFSSEVARELARLFPGQEHQAMGWLEAFMGTRGDQTLINAKLVSYHVGEVAVSQQPSVPIAVLAPSSPVPAPVAIPTPGAVPLTALSPSTQSNSTRTTAPTLGPSTITPAPQIVVNPTRSATVSPGLIDPDHFVTFTSTLLTVTAQPSPLSTRLFPLAAGRAGTRGVARREDWRVAPTNQAQESRATELVLRYEESLGNQAEDRRNQRRIGYDVYSRTPDGIERFIEIKSFLDDGGEITLTGYEWAKAHDAPDNYFLYVCTGLRGGTVPAIWIIMDPVANLLPAVESDVRISKWKAAGHMKVEWSSEPPPR